MNRYDRLEGLERAAVLYLKEHTGPQYAVTAEMVAGLLNHLAARWGCHYTVSAVHLCARGGGNPYGFGRE